MNLMHLSSFLIASVLGVVALVPSTQATPDNHTLPDRDIDIFMPNRNINGILKLEPDFFDRGREQFDLEIERLLQNQFNSEEPMLIIDESVFLDAESFEAFEEQPYLLDMAPLPEAP